VTIAEPGRIAPTAAQPADPFAIPPTAPAATRPRLLSHLGRWGRARRWLPDDARRILDVGCAFGYGSVAVAAGGPPGRAAVGIERDPEHLEGGRRLYPWLRILEGDATSLPAPDGCADAVLLLDILEHLGEPERALAEAHRVLRPGGIVVVSVPHRAPQHHLDSLNLYQALRARRPSWPPLEPATESAAGVHRHFTVGELRRLMAPRFEVDRVQRSGLGLQEPIYLAGLVARVPRRTERVGRVSLTLHLLVYLLDDLIPCGPLGYHLTVRGARREGAS
jgi:SAM-dependent methyltransferase